MEIKKALLVADITAEGLARKADLHPNTVRAAVMVFA